MLRFVNLFEQAIQKSILEAEGTVPVGVDQPCPENYRRLTKEVGDSKREKLPSCVKMSDKAIANKQSKKGKWQAGPDFAQEMADEDRQELEAELSDVCGELADAQNSEKRDSSLIQQLKSRKASLLKQLAEY